MKPAKASELFAKYQSGTCSPEEQAVVENWLTFGEAAQLDLTKEQLEEDLSAIRQRALGILGSGVGASAEKHVKARPVTMVSRLWPRIVAVAAAVTAITLGVWLYQISSSGRQETVNVFANDVDPGRHTATLTLADGSKVNLSDDKTGVVIDQSGLKYTDKTEVAASGPAALSDEVQMLTASTPRGGMYQVVLPDGTKVWLNSASSIKFPSRFTEKFRKVAIAGEVYFEVFKDPTRPFKVESRGQGVEVLGTHFNISSYADEEMVKTTLVEGRVRVASLLDKTLTDVVVLVPGQQAASTPGSGDIRVKNVDAETAIAWKNGEFVFKGEDFETAMRHIARWYNIEVIYQNKKPITLEPRGWVSRTSKLSSVLNMIQSTGDVHFIIEGRRVIVKN